MKTTLKGWTVAALFAVAIPAFAQEVVPAAQDSASDTHLRQEVSDRLFADHDLEGAMLVVSVREGRVNIVGTLKDHSQETEIYRVARQVEGVRGVFVFAEAGSQ